MKKNSLALVIQARINSSRFPKKIMKDLCGKPMIERIINRVKKIKKIKKIILATTKNKEDDILVGVAKSNNIDIYRGSENDLVDRYYQAVKNKKVKHILRLPADNPIPEPREYIRLINYHLKSKNDFSSNICNFMKNGYPDGIGIEIFTFESLKKIWENEKRKKFREHVSLNYLDYKNSKINPKFDFKVGTVKCPSNISRPKLILDINYYKDYLFIKKIYKYFQTKKKFFNARDVVDWYDNIYLRKN